MAEREGVIKFQLDHQWGRLPSDVVITELEETRAMLLSLGLVGQDPARYQGLGFGNLSLRYFSRNADSNEFLITGSQTGHLSSLTLHDYALVLKADLASNQLSSLGETRPSSESTTHALLYQLSGSIRAVIHVHSPDIWQKAEKLRLLTTPENAPYASPELIKAVTVLWQQQNLQAAGLFVMLGHQDGVIAFGPDIATALGRIEAALAAATD